MVILANHEGDSNSVNGGYTGYHSLGSLNMYGNRRREEGVLGIDGDLGSVTTRSRTESREPRRKVIIDGESVNEFDGGFGFKKGQREMLGGASEKELYAEYLRGSMRSAATQRGVKRGDSKREIYGVGLAE